MEKFSSEWGDAMFLAYDELCFQLTFEDIINEDYLNFSYKEINNCTLLHSKTAVCITNWDKHRY